jgi:hypothetical protein
MLILKLPRVSAARTRAVAGDGEFVLVVRVASECARRQRVGDHPRCRAPER